MKLYLFLPCIFVPLISKVKLLYPNYLVISLSYVLESGKKWCTEVWKERRKKDRRQEGSKKGRKEGRKEG